MIEKLQPIEVGFRKTYTYNVFDLGTKVNEIIEELNWRTMSPSSLCEACWITGGCKKHTEPKPGKPLPAHEQRGGAGSSGDFEVSRPVSEETPKTWRGMDILLNSNKPADCKDCTFSMNFFGTKCIEHQYKKPYKHVDCKNCDSCKEYKEGYNAALRDAIAALDALLPPQRSTYDIYTAQQAIKKLIKK